MAGYQTIEAMRPILHRGPVAMPVVNRDLVRPPVKGACVEPDEARPYFVTNKMIARMRKMRTEGRSLHQIAAELKVTHHTVRRLTIDIEPPAGKWSKGGGVAKFDKQKAMRLRKSGLTYQAIANALGCGESTVHGMINGRRHNRREKHPKIAILVQRIARISGHGCKDLRAPLNATPKKGDSSLSKARAILFWAAWNSAGYRKEQIGRALGGFHGTTVADGIWRTGQAIQSLGLDAAVRPTLLLSTLWHSDWAGVPCPK